ncbi:MAG: CHAT domain-containing protein [Planctomycetes bacterium]|nr:CHAT domain-containing protein [Planctomycetota bacterium]
MTYLPPLQLQTVCFTKEEHEEARKLGTMLYERLTRPLGDPLAFGAGIPVLVASTPEHVRPDAAKHVIVVAVLGQPSFENQGTRRRVLERLHAWHKELGPGHVLAVPTCAVWRNEEGGLEGKALLTKLYEPSGDARATLHEIAMAACRTLLDRRDDSRIPLFVSHTKADLEGTGHAARTLSDYVKTQTTGEAFFDATDLRPGHSLAAQLDKAAGQGVFVAVRTDAYSSRVWCQRELFAAKKSGLPTLTVEVLVKGEARSLPYAGNGPTVVWNKDPGEVVSRAMVEWLKARHFALAAAGAVSAAGLPADTICLPRPPELLDLAQGPLRATGPVLVLHPDPELSIHERSVLHRAQPRLRLVTPTTLYRRMLRNSEVPAMEAPLAGRLVAMSLSEDSDAGGPEGFTAGHVLDATVHLARTLISAGAGLAYGGDFRRGGFDALLSELIQAYNQLAIAPSDYLHSFVGATVTVEENSAVTARKMVDPEDIGEDALLPGPAGEVSPGRTALYFSDMRRVMAKRCFARILLGGQALPRGDRGPGYGGRFPGIVEEAWRTLQENAPLYVAGGFGGAAALVADLFEGRSTPERLLDAKFAGDASFVERARAIDEDPDRTRLGLPGSMEELANRVVDCAKPLLASDAASREWNGLTVSENRTLFRTRDPLLLTSLVLNGLLRVIAREARGKVRVELVRGNITEAREVDLLAVATFRDVTPGGAGADLDRVLGGRLSVARSAGQKLVSLPGAGLDADWLYLADLGALGERTTPEAVRRAAEETAEVADRWGFTRVAVVTFGGNVASDLKPIVDAMLAGFAKTTSTLTLVWFEIDEARFDGIRAVLKDRGDVLLSARRPEPSPVMPKGGEPQTIASVTYANGKIAVTVLPPGGSAAALTVSSSMSPARLEELARGEGRSTPSMMEMDARGEELAREIFGVEGVRVLQQTGDARLILLHDVTSAGLPYEALRVGERRLAITNGLVRRPAMPGLTSERLFARPLRSGALKLLLVVNPTEDLVGAPAEAAEVRKILGTLAAVQMETDLTGAAATKQAILAALARPDIDVLHYIGHAFFDGPGRDESGLVCAGGERLTLADMSGAGTPPRLAFVNACESARVRAKGGRARPGAFAEQFLKSGIEAYLGTFWRVGDGAAVLFASRVYRELAEGRSLDHAVRAGRRELWEKGEPDWANYVLYGEGSLRLREGETG